METILFHSNILSQEDVPFLNEIYSSLNKLDLQLILTGWNDVDKEWELTPHYLKLPSNIECFFSIYSREEIENDFKSYNLSVDFLLERFNWWFPEPKNEIFLSRRLGFLHYHLHHYIQLIEQYNPSLILLWNGNDPRHCILKALALSYNVKLVFLERGPMPSVLFYDSQGVLSHSTVATLPKKHFVGKYEKHLLYDKYVDWYFNSSETLWEQPNAINIDIREKFQISNDLKITLFVGQVDNDIQTKLFSPYFSSNLEAFNWFIENARDENHFVIGKHHPKSELSVNEYREVLKKQKHIVWTDELTLEDCLKIADNVVAVNSSVIFDALLYKKPVLTLGRTMLDGKGILYELIFEDSKKILQEFYHGQHCYKMNSNYIDILEYLFTNNLIFTKDFSYVKQFAEFLKAKKSINSNLAYSVKHQAVVFDYNNNFVHKIRKQKTPQTISAKFNTNIRRYLKNILKMIK